MNNVMTTKIFTNGNSQAVRLPRQFRLEDGEVCIAKEDDRIVIFPKPKITWEEFFEKHEACPEFELDRSDNVPPQERELF